MLTREEVSGSGPALPLSEHAAELRGRVIAAPPPPLIGPRIRCASRGGSARPTRLIVDAKTGAAAAKAFAEGRNWRAKMMRLISAPAARGKSLQPEEA